MSEAKIEILTWGDRYIVSCVFRGLQIISNKEFNTYDEAVEEVCKQAVREQLRLGRNNR